jgi:hypothetical protein
MTAASEYAADHRASTIYDHTVTGFKPKHYAADDRVGGRGGHL